MHEAACFFFLPFESLPQRRPVEETHGGGGGGGRAGPGPARASRGARRRRCSGANRGGADGTEGGRDW